MVVAVVLAVLPLLFILHQPDASRAPAASSVDFFTRLPVPAGETGGGVAHAIVRHPAHRRTGERDRRTPVGIGAGIYCAEYPGSRLTKMTRFVADVMNGTRRSWSGVFAWTWIVARAEALLRRWRAARALRDADDPDGDAHDRGADQAGAALAARERRSRLGYPALADQL